MTDTSIRIDSEVRRRLNVYASMHDITQGEAIDKLLEAADAPEVDTGD